MMLTFSYHRKLQHNSEDGSAARFLSKEETKPPLEKTNTKINFA